MRAFAVTIIVPAIELFVARDVVAERPSAAVKRVMMHWLREPDVPVLTGLELGFIVMPADMPGNGVRLDRFGVVVV